MGNLSSDVPTAAISIRLLVAAEGAVIGNQLWGFRAMNDTVKVLTQIRYPVSDAVNLFHVAREVASAVAPDLNHTESMKLAHTIMLTTALLQLSDTLEEISAS